MGKIDLAIVHTKIIIKLLRTRNCNISKKRGSLGGSNEANNQKTRFSPKTWEDTRNSMSNDIQDHGYKKPLTDKAILHLFEISISQEGMGQLDFDYAERMDKSYHRIKPISPSIL